MLFVAMPRFQGAFVQDDINQVSRWITFKVQALKEKAVREQRRYVLHINLDSNTIWISHSAMSLEESQAAQTKAYHLPHDINVLDVEYTDENKTSVGQTDIHFYEKGYSDKAIIHIANRQNQQRSFFIEPFLAEVRVYQEYVGLTD